MTAAIYGIVGQLLFHLPALCFILGGDLGQPAMTIRIRSVEPREATLFVHPSGEFELGLFFSGLALRHETLLFS